MTANIKNILPHILLHFGPLLFYYLPPFHYRALVLILVVTTLEWQCTTSPWPPNRGDTRAFRYGLSMSWIFVLPVVERLLLHTPERDFWRVDDLRDKKDHDRQPPQKPLDEFSWAKLRWAVALFSTPRAVGWNFGSRRINAQREQMKLQFKPNPKVGDDKTRFSFPSPRTRFILASLMHAFIGYLAWDAVMLAETKITIPLEWNWDTGTLGRIACMEVLMGVTVYSSMTMQFEAGTAVSVGLGLSDFEDWPPLFGDITECYTIANVWGKFWHQYIREPCLGFSHHLITILHIPRHSTAAYLTHLTTAFAISAFFHTFGLAAVSPGFLPLRELIFDMALFFMLQPVGTAIEGLVIRFYIRKYEDSNNNNLEQNKTGQVRVSSPRAYLRIVGYTWVLAWFYVTGWWFVKAYVGVRVMDWRPPFSFVKSFILV
ncbi:membrane bound O-acyl transferase family-domain-containing protein [Bombardia bombarda]|uniref:Membrane bound O-acyl transferase family-domain-containing protein n=1 Tax=Bombardia bombarda TaxID=252184 RepID=A0AA39XBK7_9PEZI|nr:membrane bound O-acyl transferase family-domain-containing protein [Bombardia bombarda]